jgi:hypothetical protein
MAVNVDLGTKKDPYEIRYADHSGTHSVVDFAWVSVLYLVLAVGLPQPYTPLPLVFAVLCRYMYMSTELQRYRSTQGGKF